MQSWAENEEQILPPSESDEVGAPRCSGHWGKIAAMGVLIGTVFCVSLAFMPPQSVAGVDLYHLASLSGVVGASNLDQKDDELGFPIYYSSGLQIQSGAKKWIIEFKGDEDTIANNKGKGVQAFGDKVVFKSENLHILIVKGSLIGLQLGLKNINSDEVSFAEEDTLLKAFDMNDTENKLLERNDRRLGTQENPPWGLDRIDQRDGPGDNGFKTDVKEGQGQGVHVYVMDTGIRTTHTDFGGRAIPTLETFRETRVICDPTDFNCAGDGHGHGTHCAGTVAGKKYGVAKKALVHAVQVCNARGGCPTGGLLIAWDWLVDHAKKPAVASMSLGYGGRILSHRNAIDILTQNGLTVVVAAGNENTDACDKSPAHVHTAVTVGATTKQDDRASFSNWGPCIDIFAPGKDVLSAWRGSDTESKTISGTSMACPHVAGAAALILGRSPNKTPQQITAELQQQATQGKVQDAKVNSPLNLLLFVGKGTKMRPIKWATHPEKCLDVSAGKNKPGTNIQLWDCVNEGEHDNMQFLLPESGNGPIRWAKHQTMCLDVQRGETHNGVNLQLWDCVDDGEHANMQFIVPAHQGHIKWAQHVKCIDVEGGGLALSTNIQMWDCIDGGQHANMQFIVDES